MLNAFARSGVDRLARIGARSSTLYHFLNAAAEGHAEALNLIAQRLDERATCRPPAGVFFAGMATSPPHLSPTIDNLGTMLEKSV